MIMMTPDHDIPEGCHGMATTVAYGSYVLDGLRITSTHASSMGS